MATTTADRLAAFRLRYDVYIAEQGKPYPEADHDERLLADELDDEAAVVVVSHQARVVGTVRANWFDAPETCRRYDKVFQTDRFATIAPSQMAVCSRLAVMQERRYSPLGSALLSAVYEEGLSRRTVVCFATCTSSVFRMFKKFGSREYAAPVMDPVVGLLHRTVLVLDDLAHFERVGSPLLTIALRKNVPNAERPWLRRIVDEYGGNNASA